MYDEKTKYKAVVLFKMTGNQHITAQQLGIDVKTIQVWRKEDWWKEMEEEVRLQSRSEMSTSLQKIVDKAMTQVSDRVENGDWIYDQKLGKMIRKPINAHVANQILKDSITNTNLIEKLKDQDRQHATAEKIQDTLAKLAVEFEKFAKMRLIEGEKTDAIPEEREAGLQGGTSLGAPAPGTDETTGGETRSPSPRDESRQGA